MCEERYFVYILLSDKYGRYYIGQTDDLILRLSRHNSGQVFSTKAYVPWKLVHYELFRSRSEAVNRERAIKRKKSRRYIESLLNRQSPDGCRD